MCQQTFVLQIFGVNRSIYPDIANIWVGRTYMKEQHSCCIQMYKWFRSGNQVCFNILQGTNLRLKKELMGKVVWFTFLIIKVV